MEPDPDDWFSFTWNDADDGCDSTTAFALCEAPAVCESVPSADVIVSLPAALPSSGVTPALAAASSSVAVTYTPPVPVVTRSAGYGVVSPYNAVAFNIAVDATGLATRSLEVNAQGLTASTSLSQGAVDDFVGYTMATLAQVYDYSGLVSLTSGADPQVFLPGGQHFSTKAAFTGPVRLRARIMSEAPGDCVVLRLYGDTNPGFATTTRHAGYTGGSLWSNVNGWSGLMIDADPSTRVLVRTLEVLPGFHEQHADWHEYDLRLQSVGGPLTLSVDGVEVVRHETLSVTYSRGTVGITPSCTGMHIDWMSVEGVSASVPPQATWTDAIAQSAQRYVVLTVTVDMGSSGGPWRTQPGDCPAGYSPVASAAGARCFAYKATAVPATQASALCAPHALATTAAPSDTAAVAAILREQASSHAGDSWTMSEAWCVPLCHRGVTAACLSVLC